MTGEIELTADDVTGIAVHIAARVGAKAPASETVVSRTVRDLVAGSSRGWTPLPGACHCLSSGSMLSDSGRCKILYPSTGSIAGDASPASRSAKGQ
jgi:hypothetical protein